MDASLVVLGEGTYARVVALDGSRVLKSACMSRSSRRRSACPSTFPFDAWRELTAVVVLSDAVKLITGTHVYEATRMTASLHHALVMRRAKSTASAEARAGPLPDAVSVAFDVGLLLAVAHARGLLHRDVKPANVLLFVTDGARGRRRALLADWGMAAVALGGVGVGGGAPMDDGNVVSLRYRPPELLLGDAARIATEGSPLSLGPAMDVWSFGLLLLTMLLGRTAGESTAETPEQQVAFILNLLRDTPHADDGRRTRRAFCSEDVDTEAALLALADGAAVHQVYKERAAVRTRDSPLQDARLSSAALDVLRACLQMRPDMRPSMTTLLRMPFFADAGGGPRAGLPSCLRHNRGSNAGALPSPYPREMNAAARAARASALYSAERLIAQLGAHGYELILTTAAAIIDALVDGCNSTGGWPQQPSTAMSRCCYESDEEALQEMWRPALIKPHALGAAAAIAAANFAYCMPLSVPRMEAAAMTTLGLRAPETRAAVAHVFNALSGNALFATPFLIAALHAETLLARVTAPAARAAWNRVRSVAAVVVHAPWYVCSNPWFIAAGVLRLCDGVSPAAVERVSGVSESAASEMRATILEWLGTAHDS